MNVPSGQSKIFSLSETVDQQMNRFAVLREQNPVKAKEIFNIGEKLVSFSSQGSYSKFKTLVRNTEPSDILWYFCVKAFKEALLHNHLLVSDYMVENGFPILNKDFPLVLNECLYQVDDFHGAGLVNFFVSKGYDINAQAKTSWLSALHIAVERQLFETCKMLIKHGADVNSVSHGDKMPLSIAEQVSVSSHIRNEIIQLLISKGGRNTWKSEKKSFSGGGGYIEQQSTMVSFRGGGAVVVTSSSTDDISVKEVDLDAKLQSEEIFHGLSDDGGMLFSTS